MSPPPTLRTRNSLESASPWVFASRLREIESGLDEVAPLQRLYHAESDRDQGPDAGGKPFRYHFG
jgi:hypothetical protein